MEENNNEKPSLKERYNRKLLSIVRKKSTREYYKELKELEKKEGKEIDSKVRESLRKSILTKNARNLHLGIVKAAVAAAFTGLVITGGATVHTLNEGSGIVEGVEEEKNSPENNSEKQTLRDRYRVETSDTIINESELENNITSEVEALEDKEAVLNYVKEPLLDNYNNLNDENKTKEGISIWRTHDNVVYSDIASNGENIIRVCSEEYAKEHGLLIHPSTGDIITTRVDNKIVEVIVGIGDHFELAYLENEEVLEPREGISEDLGNLLNAGIGYATTLSEESAKDNQASYRKKLIDEMVKYKELQAKQVISEQDNGFEIGD